MAKPLFGKPIDNQCFCGKTVEPGERQQVELHEDKTCWIRVCGKCLAENDRTKSSYARN